jgi:hypothetical protein
MLPEARLQRGTRSSASPGSYGSLARPGGNITGSTFLVPELVAKRLELLKEAIPGIKQVAILVKPDNPLLRTPAPSTAYRSEVTSNRAASIRGARSGGVRNHFFGNCQTTR